jgi:hypothetical protein
MKDPYNVIVEYHSRVPAQCLQGRVYLKPKMKSLQDAVDNKTRSTTRAACRGSKPNTARSATAPSRRSFTSRHVFATTTNGAFVA